MEIRPAGSQPSGRGSAEYFSGTVRIDPLNSPPEPARVAMALVTFEPGARTAWSGTVATSRGAARKADDRSRVPNLAEQSGDSARFELVVDWQETRNAL